MVFFSKSSAAAFDRGDRAPPSPSSSSFSFAAAFFFAGALAFFGASSSPSVFCFLRAAGACPRG